MQLTGPHWAIVFGLQRMTKYNGKITIEHFFNKYTKIPKTRISLKILFERKLSIMDFL